MGRRLEKKSKKAIKNAVLTMIESGVSISKACTASGIGRTAFYRWCNCEEKFNNSVEMAKQSRISFVEDSLFKSCLDGNVTAQIFFLTNKADKLWRDRRAVINNNVNTSVVNNSVRIASKIKPEEVDDGVRKRLAENFAILQRNGELAPRAGNP